jgi:hypothetical protein
MSINYVHFDTQQREDLTTDSFSCELKISNPLRNVKKIYLKSAEIPVGFFNIRETQYFEYVSSHINYTDINPSTLRVYGCKPNYENNYFKDEDHDDLYFVTRPIKASPSSTLTPQQENAYKISIAISPGNYTIKTLLDYINDKLRVILYINEPSFLNIAGFPFAPTFELSLVNSSDSRIFPIGLIRASFNSVYVWIVPTEFSYKYLGFNEYVGTLPRLQSNVTSDLPIINSLRPWNVHQDLCIYLYLENIPQTNTHFKTNLASFKIPVKSGYQSIEYNTENISFAQYIENTDGNYTLDTIKLKVYDRNNTLINNNGFDFKFTLGIETGNI